MEILDANGIQKPLLLPLSLSQSQKLLLSKPKNLLLLQHRSLPRPLHPWFRCPTFLVSYTLARAHHDGAEEIVMAGVERSWWTGYDVWFCFAYDWWWRLLLSPNTPFVIHGSLWMVCVPSLDGRMIPEIPLRWISLQLILWFLQSWWG